MRSYRSSRHVHEARSSGPRACSVVCHIRARSGLVSMTRAHSPQTDQRSFRLSVRHSSWLEHRSPHIAHKPFMYTTPFLADCFRTSDITELLSTRFSKLPHIIPCCPNPPARLRSRLIRLPPGRFAARISPQRTRDRNAGHTLMYVAEKSLATLRFAFQFESGLLTA